MQPAIGEQKTGRRGRRPLRGARPETWRDTCGRGVPIGGVQTRDAGAAAEIGVQAIRCGTFLHRSYNWTKGKSKNRWFLAAFFSIFLSLLKEIWPPEAYMQDAGAARNRRTENGPSGTPAPTEVMLEVHSGGSEYLGCDFGQLDFVPKFGASGRGVGPCGEHHRQCQAAGRCGHRPLRNEGRAPSTTYASGASVSAVARDR